MRAGVFQYSPALLMNGTEAELGPWTGETGSDGNRKMPLTGLNRRPDIRHGNGHLVRPHYRRITELRQRVQPQCSHNRGADGTRKSAAAAIKRPDPKDKDDFPARSKIEWPGRRLHRTLQEFTDRHRRPRKFAKNPVVFGQEPGRGLLQSREQRPFVLTAMARHR